MDTANFTAPAQVRMQKDHMILYGIIDGQRKPATLQAYLRCLTNELEALDEGIETYDAATDTRFFLRAKLLASCQDYQGYKDVASQRVSGTP